MRDFNDLIEAIFDLVLDKFVTGKPPGLIFHFWAKNSQYEVLSDYNPGKVLIYANYAN